MIREEVRVNAVAKYFVDFVRKIVVTLHDMSSALLNTKCLVQACKKLNIPYVVHDNYGNFVEIALSQKYFFINFTTPWNSTSSSKLCADKEFTYRLLHRHISMPRTMAFFDPKFVSKKYNKYKTLADLDKIIDQIKKQFGFPLIIKMNSGSKKRNVFLCDTDTKIKKALRSIYNHSSPHYDYIAVAQEYITIAAEYRVVIFKGNILVIYTKHDERAHIISDVVTIERIKQFIAPIFIHTDVQFAGLDIAIDANNAMWLFEMNSAPGFDRLARACGEQTVTALYEKMLATLQ